MIQIVLIIGALLILVVFALVFRVQTLVDVLRGTHKKRASTSNKVNAVLMLVFLVVGFPLMFWSAWQARADFLPDASSVHGVVVDDLLWVTMAIIGAAFLITNFLLFYFSWRYQFKEGRKAHFFPDNNKLEIIWTVIPAFVLAALVFSGWKAWVDITSEAPEGSVQVEIVGKQFNWYVRYPGADDKIGMHNYRLIDATNQLGMDFTDKANFDDFMAREVHIPVNKPVLFKIRSRDVIHSVFAPHFRLKMDAVPGMPTQFWFTPTKTTAEMREETGNPNFVYEIACTEICGRGHFGMRSVIVVESEEEYKEWFAQQKSFLSQNPEYYAQVPAKLKPIAALQFPNGIPSAQTQNAVDSTATPAPTAGGLTGTAAPEEPAKSKASF
jgi:cytochrome c oxidase subunit 2